MNKFAYLQMRHQNLCLSILIKSTNGDVLLTHTKNVSSIRSISLYIIVCFGKITLFFLLTVIIEHFEKDKTPPPPEISFGQGFSLV